MDVHEGTRHHDQAAIRLARLCGNYGFQLGRVANRRDDRFHRKGRSRSSEGVQIILGVGRGCRIKQEDYQVNAWSNILKQLKPLASSCWLNKDVTRDVANLS